MTSAELERTLNSSPLCPATFKEPMECLAVPRLPDGPHWLFEIKLDGYRAIAVKSGGRLRERREDIPLLVEYFINRYTRKVGKSIRHVNEKTLALLQSYPWPGNIRELQNVIERSVIVSEIPNFSVDESWFSQQLIEKKAGSPLYLSEKMAAQEKEIIEAALQECQGRVSGPSGAAAKLGIARSTLESKIRSLKINKYHFKA